MQMLWQRRVALFCLVFTFTGFFFAVLPSSLVHVAAIAALSLLLLSLPLLFFKNVAAKTASSVKVLRVALAAFLFAFLFFRTYEYARIDRIVEKYESVTASVTATVVETKYATSFAAGYMADIRTEDGDRFRVLLESDDLALARGDVLTCTVTFYPFEEYDGSFPERRHYYSLGAVLRGEAETCIYEGDASFSLTQTFSDFRAYLSGLIRQRLGRKEGAFAAALFLGDRTDLSEAFERDFRRLGISHLLAISGMHFTVLLSLANNLLSNIFPGKKGRVLLLSLLCIGYMLLCGMSEAVVRGGIMMLLSFAALFFDRAADMPSSLGIASFLICLFDPTAIYSVGFQLSVTAVLGLCLFSHIQNTLHREDAPKRFPRLSKITSPILLSVTVQLVLLPLSCLYFGECSLLTPIATLLFSPLVDFTLLLTPVFLLSTLMPPLAPILGGILLFLTRIITQLAAVLAAIPDITVSLRYDFAPFFCVVLSAGAFLLALCRERKALQRGLFGLNGVFLLFVFTAALYVARIEKDVILLSAAQGKNDSVIVMTAGETMLIDVSDGSYTALKDAYCEAAKNGATEISVLYLTHLHDRHAQSVRRLFDFVYVRSVFLPVPITEKESAVVDTITLLCNEAGVPVHFYETTNTVHWHNRVEIQPHTRTYLARSTHPVIAFTLKAKEQTVVYLGSSATEIETNRDQSTTDILICGRHGPVEKTVYPLILPESLGAAVLRAERDIPLETSRYAGEETGIFALDATPSKTNRHPKENNGLKQNDNG